VNQRKVEIQWPPSSKKAIWQQFDQDVDIISNASLAREIDEKKEAMTTIIYNVGCDRYSVKERKQPRETAVNKKQDRERSAI
jgi:hypothetical protein